MYLIGCINHGIVAGLCSELFMRLPYFIHIGYCKKLSSHMGIEPRSFLPEHQSANSCYFEKIIIFKPSFVLRSFCNYFSNLFCFVRFWPNYRITVSYWVLSHFNYFRRPAPTLTTGSNLKKCSSMVPDFLPSNNQTFIVFIVSDVSMCALS